MCLPRSQDAPPATSGGPIGTGALLDVDWCGLNRPDLAGAWAIVDGGSGQAEPDTLVDARKTSSLPQGMASLVTPALAGALTTLMTTSTFTDIAGLQSGVYSAAVPASAHGAAAVVPDGSGGFAIPMTNRFTALSGLNIAFCSIVYSEPYNQLVAFGTFPVYTNAPAAAADTGLMDSTAAAPIAIPGYNLSSGGDALMYYIPNPPVSTGGVVCVTHAAQAAIEAAAPSSTLTFLSPKEFSRHPQAPALEAFPKHPTAHPRRRSSPREQQLMTNPPQSFTMST